MKFDSQNVCESETMWKKLLVWLNCGHDIEFQGNYQITTPNSYITISSNFDKFCFKLHQYASLNLKFNVHVLIIRVRNVPQISVRLGLTFQNLVSFVSAENQTCFIQLVLYSEGNSTP